MESLSFLGGRSGCSNVRLVMELPIAGHLLFVLEADLHCLSSLNADLAKVEILSAHRELWNGKVGNELDRVRWTSLDIDVGEPSDSTKLGVLPGGISDMEER